MLRSVEELRRESEQSREQLAATVDRLKGRITDTADDLRHKVSPQAIKSEMSDFVSRKTHGWFDMVKQQARENPIQAIAVGTAVAVPALRLARGFPLPLLMIGAGLALTSKSVREAAAPAMEKAREMVEEATERVQSLRGDAADAVSSSGQRAADLADEAKAGMSGIAGELKDRANETADQVKAGAQVASAKATEAIERARSTASAAPEMTRHMIRDNAALIGGIGVALGAILAASLPDTRTEAAVIGKASDSVKRAAGRAAQSGFETAKEGVLSATDAAAKSVSDADLGKHISRMTENMSDRLKAAADDVMSAAINPSRTDENPS
jgi:hypothetical protein